MKFWPLIFLISLSAQISRADVKWLAFGDLRGYFEPCGCDPSTDLGGVARLDAYLARERLFHKDMLLFHLGNAYGTELAKVVQQKNSSIGEALGALGIQASLVNRVELTSKNLVQPSNLPYVLSNHQNSSKPVVPVQKSIELPGAVVFGFVEPFSGYKGLESFQKTSWPEKKKTAENKPWILLYSGSKETLQLILRSKLFDTIISSNDWPVEKKFADEERRNETTLIRLSENGKDILKTPRGGQGVIRSENLQSVAPAQAFSKLLDTSSKSNTTASSFLSRRYVAWLPKDEEVGVSDKMKSVVSDYRSASSSEMKKLVQEKTENLKSTPYVGAEACQSCHAGSYKVWQESKHAKAFATIQDAKRESDPECVSCHVLGFHEKGGFASLEASPKFKDVQCENCHGPRRDHVANPSIKSTVDAKAACDQCHTPPHSPKFNYKTYWKMIEHK